MDINTQAETFPAITSMNELIIDEVRVTLTPVAGWMRHMEDGDEPNMYWSIEGTAFIDGRKFEIETKKFGALGINFAPVELGLEFGEKALWPMLNRGDNDIAARTVTFRDKFNKEYVEVDEFGMPKLVDQIEFLGAWTPFHVIRWGMRVDHVYGLKLIAPNFAWKTYQTRNGKTVLAAEVNNRDVEVVQLRERPKKVAGAWGINTSYMRLKKSV